MCQFPPTFRNIRIKGESAPNSDVGESSSSEQPAVKDVYNYLELLSQLDAMRKETERLTQKNIQLWRKNKKLESECMKLQRSIMYEESSSGSHLGKEGVQISGETSELGPKYYGPQSSNFMIENLKNKSSGHVDKDSSSEPQFEEEGKFPENTGEPTEPSISGGKDNKVNKSNIWAMSSKKPLPRILQMDAGDYKSSLGSYNKDNLKIISQLVENLFSSNDYYECFLSKRQMLEFLSSYDSIGNNEWENDDDLLLLYVILLLLYVILMLLVERLTPKEFIEVGIVPENFDVSKNYKKLKKKLVLLLLFKNFEALRHNLLLESIITVQAYLLCLEWYFIQQKYEECWSMLFHTCSIAFSLGIDVMGKFRAENESFEEDIARYKVWLALRNISGQICSVLGRPNPVSMQVNSVVMMSSAAAISKLELSKYKIHVLLKGGLGECLRLSNMMLIENFMIDFSLKDLLQLDSKFEEEINILEYFLTNEEQDEEEATGVSLRKQTFDLPQTLSKHSIICDLIVFYINRSKLFEPFIVKFQEQEQSAVIIRSIYASLMKFLDAILEFLDIFFEPLIEKYVDNSSNYLKEVKFGKQFRLFHPYLNSFIYQGVIIIFTFLHYEDKAFINYSNLPNAPINYEECLDFFETKLHSLLSYEKKFEKLSLDANRLWSTNFTHLAKKNLEVIAYIRQKRVTKLQQEYDRETFDRDLEDYHAQIEAGLGDNFVGFYVRDPFWITNPDNLPYYISSPSDASFDSTGSQKSVPVAENQEDYFPSTFDRESDMHEQESTNLPNTHGKGEFIAPMQQEIQPEFQPQTQSSVPVSYDSNFQSYSQMWPASDLNLPQSHKDFEQVAPNQPYSSLASHGQQNIPLYHSGSYSFHPAGESYDENQPQVNFAPPSSDMNVHDPFTSGTNFMDREPQNEDRDKHSNNEEDM